MVLVACAGDDSESGATTTTADTPPPAGPSTGATVTTVETVTTVGTATTGGTLTSVGPGTAAPTDDAPILTAGTGTGAGTGAATALAAVPDCIGTPPRPLVALTWQPSGAGEQRVDVTVHADGFATGRYESSTSLAPTTSRLEWDRAQGEATHHWRVLTRTRDAWTSSAPATFPGPGCVGADFQD